MWRYELLNRFASRDQGNVDTRISLHVTRWGARQKHTLLQPFLAARNGRFSVVLRDRRTGAEETLSVQ